MGTIGGMAVTAAAGVIMTTAIRATAIIAPIARTTAATTITTAITITTAMVALVTTAAASESTLDSRRAVTRLACRLGYAGRQAAGYLLAVERLQRAFETFASHRLATTSIKMDR